MGTDGQQAAPDPQTQQQEQELLVRLAQAKADLKAALEQQEENRNELHECAENLLEVVDEVERYLMHLFGAGNDIND
jgi:hypothetical protein